jgi:acetyl esterase/lipase
MPHPADTLPAEIAAVTTVERDLPYVNTGHPRQTLDLYLPQAERPLPLIIWIHGGAFRMGSKEDDVPVEQLGRGYAIAAINYRLSQHALFPAQIEDCKAAVRWLRSHAASYGIDGARFATYGTSAGGHLAAMVGTTGAEPALDVGAYLDVSSRVQAVVDFYGPTDFLQMDAQRLPDGMLHDTPDSPESQLVGGPIQERRAQVAAANPIPYVRADAPPFLVIHGDRDPLVPHGQSTLLVEALQKAGVPVTFYTVKGGGHGHFSDPQIAPLVQEFLDKHLG